MINHLSTLTARRRSEEGASAVEYGLLVALIAAIIVAAVFLLGSTVNGAFTDANDCIDNQGVGDACAPAE